MGVHRNSGMAKGHAHYHIGSFSSHPRQFLQGLKILWHLPSIVLQKQLAEAGRPWLRFAIPDTGQEILMVSAGLGDGFYSAFWGYDADDRITDLVTVFIDPDLYASLCGEKEEAED